MRPPNGGLWSGPKVANWITEQVGRRVHTQCGWSNFDVSVSANEWCVLVMSKPTHKLRTPLKN
ncbi:hypothetical protein KSZ_51170 [Dictyobacter formicarum]|uniref:Uncharacterized protein n=1 Tax=Dictyobacter formicarum TaxID=2778368 RepID=A0ABQ3VN56_9CHLR|nr:hypothetical protein KSZ_51170 [Dictyobacter formicarum]